MLGNIAMFVANRAAGSAVGSITRWASWGMAAAVFALGGLAFALCALFWYLEPRYGAINTAGLMALALMAVALVCILTPSILDYAERQAAARAAAAAGPVKTTLEAANVETAAAVDYFGPLQVVASAFLMGMKTAQSFQGRRQN